MAEGEKSACVSSRPKFTLPLTAQASGSIYMSELGIQDHHTKRRISPSRSKPTKTVSLVNKRPFAGSLEWPWC